MIESIKHAYGGMVRQESLFEESARKIAGGAPKSNDSPSEGNSSQVGASSAVTDGPAAGTFLLDVDIGREMVNMNVAKRAYEANAKAVVASDEMLEEILDLDV